MPTHPQPYVRDIVQKKTGLLTLDDFFAFFWLPSFFAHFSPISSDSNFWLVVLTEQEEETETVASVQK